MSGTSGGPGVTSGAWPRWLPVSMVAAVGAVIALINATSEILEAGNEGRTINVSAPFVWEVSSWIMVVALAPVVGLLIRRFPPGLPPGAAGWARFGLVHLAGATAVSMAHIAGMVMLRKIAYAAGGSVYVFANGDLALSVLYEWRKDLLMYAAIALPYVLYDSWVASKASAESAGRATPADGDARIEIRDGGRVFLVEPSEIAWIEAAGNYVEIHTGGATHLARGTLAAFEARLGGRGFVRVHRSRLVNRARIRAFKATPSGDLEITLEDGRTVAGSRRFRGAVDTAG